MKLLTLLSCLFLELPVQAALTLYYGNYNGGGILRDINGISLTTGPKENPGNGAVIQIGYYSLATSADPFAGDWVVLVGPGTSVEAANIGEVLGSFYVNSGHFGGTATFSTAVPGEPAPSTPLAIRFYDGTSIDSSIYYNAVSMDDWRWRRPRGADTTVNMTIRGAGIPGLVWEGGESSAYRTTIAVPEASTGIFILVAGSAMLGRRKRYA
jgi:hypothetical protein